MKNPAKPILLVEDDQIDTMTVIRALKELHVTNRVEHVENGEAALDYLRDPAKERPCLILLDLNMPIMGGIEFLRVVKGDEITWRKHWVVLLGRLIGPIMVGVSGLGRRCVYPDDEPHCRH